MNSQKRILKYQMDNLVKELLVVLFASTIVAAVSVYMMKEYIDINILIIWFSGILFANTCRYLIKVKYEKDHSPVYKKYLNRYSFFTVLSAAVWGLISIISIGQLPENFMVLYVSILLGMVSGGAISNIPHKPTAILYIIFMVIPFIAKVLIEQQLYFLPFSGMIIVFTYLMLKLVLNYNKQSIDGFKLFLDKEHLLLQVEENFELENELKEQKLHSMQNSKLASLGEMAAGVAHEINNPLTIVMGLLWKLKIKFKTDQESVEMIEDTEKAAKRIGTIVLSMKNLSRIKNPQELETIDINDVVKTVDPLVNIDLKESDVFITWSVENFQFKAHLSEISQVVYNIIINGIYALKDLDGHKEIIVQTREDDSYSYIDIIDTGLGIPQNIRDKIFEPFFTTKDVGKGTGLGLSLSQSIIKSFEGELSYTKNPRSCFTISLPKL